MSEEEGQFSKARLEAFSDGVIGVIITIMVLDLKAPDSDRLDELIKLWPAFLSYFISFLFGAIYWINHHNLFAQARRVTPGMIWANNLLLFCLSLFPFSTAYMAATHISSTATMVYGAVQFACGLSFDLLSRTIARQRKGDSAYEKHHQAHLRKNMGAHAFYLLATGAAFFSPAISLIIFGGIAIAYFVPELLAGRGA